VLTELCSDLRSRNTHHEEEESEAEKDHPDPSLGTGIGRHQGIRKGLVTELAHTDIPSVPFQTVQKKHYRDEQQQNKILRLSEKHLSSFLSYVMASSF
jgi:hypothetical protein